MAFFITRFLIALWTLLVTAGWVLSAAGCLNRTGYTVALLLGAAVSCAFGRPNLRWSAGAWRRRSRRALPAGFGLLMLAVLAAGLIYPPNTFDALTYRLPRLLHWLAHERWHWIHTAFARLNTRAPDAEWSMAPFVLFFHSERWSWVLNAASFAALPGLVFSMLKAVGTRPRAAERWMWLLPSGYIFVLQASGDSNDLPGAFFALASVALALRARTKGCAGDLLWSVLAIALATGVKASNLPLALPWLVAAWPSLRLLGRRPALSAVAFALALTVSFVPLAFLNERFCGDWTGANIEAVSTDVQAPLWVRLSSNFLRLAVQNLSPPIFPMASAWNAWAANHIPASYYAKLEGAVEAPKSLLNTVELPSQDTAGTGPLLPFLAAACGLGSLLFCGTHGRSGAPGSERWLQALRWSPWIALVVFTAKMNLAGAGRLAAPYYLLLPMLLVAGEGAAQMTRSGWWRKIAVLQMAIALLAVVVAPASPLFPALTLFHHLPARLQATPMAARLLKVLTIFRERPDCLAPVRALIPEGEKVVGLEVFIEPEASLWRPYGTRQFEHVFRSDSLESLAQQHIQYVLRPVTPEEPAQNPLGQVGVQVLASEAPETWVLERWQVLK